MKKILMIFLFFFMCSAVQKGFSAAFTSTQNGDWSSSATWGGAGVPGNNDTVTIAHNVTVDVNTVAGHSPGADHTVAAIEVSGGHLTVAAGVALVCRGALFLNAGDMTLDAGAVLEMDASQASDPFASSYKIDIVPNSGNSNALLRANGTVESHCVIRSNAGGAYAQITCGGGVDNGGRLIADYCDFIRLGDADNEAWIYCPGDAPYLITNCTWNTCSRIAMPFDHHIPSLGQVEFVNCLWTNSVRGNHANIFQTGAFLGATAKIIRCYFDEYVFLHRPNDYEVEDCVFAKGVKLDRAAYSVGLWKSFKRNFVRSLTKNAEFNFQYGVTIEDCILIKDTPHNNPHYSIIHRGTGATLFKGNVIWHTGTDKYSEGDVWMPYLPASGTREDNTITIERNIYLPNGNGPEGPTNLSGTGFTILFHCTDNQVVFKRNTLYVGGGTGGCNLGETQTAEQGVLAYYKSNLNIGAVKTSGQLTGEKLDDYGHAETDVVLAENADYNAGYLLQDGTNYGNGSGKGYNDLTFSGSSVIGAHDIDDTDPQFVDDTRTPVTWDAYLGGTGTMQGTMERLAPGVGHTMQDLLDYIREGFRPQNLVLQGAGDPDDGSPDIGAVDMYQPVVEAPSDLTAVAAGDTQINLNWTDKSDNEYGFSIERSSTSQLSGFMEMGSVGSDVETFSDTSVTLGTVYYYRVRAYQGNDYSSYSNTASAVTGSAVILPPIDLTIDSVTDTSIVLSWQDHPDNQGVVGYIINCNGVDIETDWTALSYTDPDLIPDTDYTYTVRAYDASNDQSDPCVSVSAKTLNNDDPPSDVVEDTLIQAGDIWQYFKGTSEPPSDWRDTGFDDTAWLSGPTGIGYNDNDDATVLNDMSGNYITVYLRKSFDNPFSAYESIVLSVDYDDGFVAYINGVEVARSNITGEPAYDVGASAQNEAGTPADYDLTAQSHLFTPGTNVLAIQLRNASLYSSDASMIPSLTITGYYDTNPDTTPPSPPTGLQASDVTDTEVHLAWNPCPETDVSGYRVYRDNIELGTSVVPNFQDQALIPSTTYQYTVTAFDQSNNESLASGVLTVTTLAEPDTTPPLAPINLSAPTATQTTVDLVWENPVENTDVTGYRIYRDNTEIGTSANTNYSDQGLTPNTPYNYTVTAYDATNNESPVSAVLNVSTLQTTSDPVEQTLIQEGDMWQYFKGTSEPPSDWRDTGFDDTSWLSGPSGFGYADNDDATVLEDMSGNYVTVYLRKTFDNPFAAYESIFLNLYYDDGFVAYINGVEVARDNIVGEPAYDQPASGQHESNRHLSPAQFDISAFSHLLLPGTNVLAIQLRNAGLYSSDASMIPSLTINGYIE